MDSAEHTSFKAAPARKGGRGLRIAAVVVLVLAAFGWLVMSARTNPGTTPKSAAIADASSRRAQGVIRMASPPQEAGTPEPSTGILAGLKLDRTLHTRTAAQPESAERSRAPVER